MPDFGDSANTSGAHLAQDSTQLVVSETALGAFGMRDVPSEQPPPVFDLGAMFSSPGAQQAPEPVVIEAPPAPTEEVWGQPRPLYDVSSMFGGQQGQAEPIIMKIEALEPEPEAVLSAPEPARSEPPQQIFDIASMFQGLRPTTLPEPQAAAPAPLEVAAPVLPAPEPSLQEAPQGGLAAFLSAFAPHPPAETPAAAVVPPSQEILAIEGLDLPRAVATSSVMDRVFGFEKPEAAALLVAFPHYELGAPEARTVSHLEARLMLAEIHLALEDRGKLSDEELAAPKAPPTRELDQMIERLKADGYLREVPFRGEAAAALDDVLRAYTPERWDALLKGNQHRAYQLTDEGVTAAQVLRAWDGKGEVALSLDAPAGPGGFFAQRQAVVQRLQLPVEMPEAVPYEAFTAGWATMTRRMEAGLLDPGDMGRYIQGELASVAASLDRSAEPDVVLGKVETLLDGLRDAAIFQIELGYTPDRSAPLRAEDIDGAIRMAEAVTDRLPRDLGTAYPQPDGSVKQGVLDLGDVEVLVAHLEGIRVSMEEITGAKAVMAHGQVADPEHAWRPIQDVPRVHTELSPLAERSAIRVVQAWLNQTAEGLDNGAQVAARNFDTFLDRALGAKASAWRGVLNPQAA